MIIIPLARSRYGKAKNEESTKEQWDEILNEFTNKTRLEAANLAAHSWDVTFINDRLLISCAWYEAKSTYWHDKDGTKTKLTEQEYDQFYPIVDPTLKYPDASSQTGKPRGYTLQTDWLKEQFENEQH